ncbi:UvrD/REP helicase [gut metagenome]|uniref:DNA 3'-5' helicase n=1 Tax=gut metagenome TaxID=749906 RepID=J9FX68_9ZZZZ
MLYNEGPSLVIAGAGSGKTRVLTYKIAYLLEQGYLPSSILALTFTNKAAREMKERIARQVGPEARRLWMGTFHSIFSRILRKESAVLGFTPNFTIYDSSDSKNLLKTIIKEKGFDEKTYKPGSVQSHISNAKNHLVLPLAYASNPQLLQADASMKMPKIYEIYQEYWNRCRQSDAMDFDDLLVYTFILFHNFPEVCRRYAEQFRYVLVDEYQDTNFAQHSIVQQLTSVYQQVCVVGDDAQSIYSFRGANIENILKFTKIYPNARLFKLEQNYRSTQNIVRAANSLIEKNSEQIRKEVFSEKAEGDRIQVFSAYSDIEEGEIVANQLQRLHLREHEDFRDFAILYRTNAQSRIFEEALRKRSVPYRIYGGLSFYQRKEIKDLIAYFRLAVNSHDEEAFKRVLNYPARGIGDTTLKKLQAAAVERRVSLWTVLEEPLTYGVSINKGTHAKLQGFRALIETFRAAALEKDAYELGAQVVRESGIMADLCQNNDPENLSRRENVDELVTGLHDFVATRQEEGNEHIYLTDFLSEVSLLTDQDNERDDEEAKVTLMTIHSAKGLEFRNVFIVGMEEELFPAAQSVQNYKALEEERRLFYVALTRAEERCYLSYAKSRFKYGKTEFSAPSRFLKDINPRYLDLPAEDRLQRQVDEGASRFRRQQEGGSLFGHSGTDGYGSAGFGNSSWEGHVGGNRSATRSGASAPSATFPSSGASRPEGHRKAQLFGSSAPRHLTRVSSTAGTSSGNASAASSASASSAQVGGVSLCVGHQIEHERFGRGEVIRLEGTGDNCKATVRFQHAGEKQLLLKFARFKVVG